MKVLYLGYPSGAERAPHQEMAALHLVRLGHRVDHVCWGGLANDRSAKMENLEYLPMPKRGLLSALKLLGFLFKKVGIGRGYDVLYVQGAQQTLFVFWFPLVKGRIRSVYHSQDYLEPGRHLLYERFERWFARHADYVVSNEVNRGRFMKSYYALPNLPAVVRTALPAWWDMPERSEAQRRVLLEESGVASPEQAVVVMAGGAYRPDRMSPQLLEAFALLPEHFVLVFNGAAMAPGRDSRLACELHMKSLGLSGRVVFRSGVSFTELLSLYSIGEVGMLLYPNDGIGHFYQCPGRFSEYVRNGLSLVSSNFPCLELLTLKYGLGAVCNPESPREIADALMEAGTKAKSRRTNIIATAEREFVYEATAGILEEILEGTYEHFQPSVTT